MLIARKPAKVKDLVSEAEWKTRVDLAACYRLVDHYGMCDMIYNHVSAAVPGEHGHFLLNPYGMMYEEITASSLVKVDLAGKLVFQPDPQYSINLAGYVIHSAIHEAMPHIGCVIHTHTVAGMAVSALDCGLLPLCQTAMRFPNIGYHDYEGVALETGERERLVEHLGNSQVMILRNHGLLAVGRTIGEAFNSIYRLERACQVQLEAMACNTKLRMPPEEALKRANQQLAQNHAVYEKGGGKPFGEMEWPALLRMLDRRDPSYRE